MLLVTLASTSTMAPIIWIVIVASVVGASVLKHRP